MLNAFSFSGGFSLYAARGQARSATDLDISAHALASAKRNFQLNQLDPSVAACHHETIQADVFDWLQSDNRRLFDLIVLDPPAFCGYKNSRWPRTRPAKLTEAPTQRYEARLALSG